ncbi:MAG: hypothetical protein ACTHPD_08060 [Rhizomicrobium sp.]
MTATPYTSIDEQWLFDRGELHDARVLAWRFEQGVVTIQLDDAWSNFEGLPEYPGKEEGCLVVSGAKHCPDFASVISELVLSVVLVKNDNIKGLKVRTIAYPPIEVVGEGVFWHPKSASQD